MDLEKAKLEFIEYTDKYRRLGKECIRKINHTFRVMDLCGEIAESLNLSDEEIKLAKLCGLLHDLGRFEQWKRYKTFNDMEKVHNIFLNSKILLQTYVFIMIIILSSVPCN